MSLSQHLEVRQAHPCVFTCSLVHLPKQPQSQHVVDLLHKSQQWLPDPREFAWNRGSVCVCVYARMHSRYHFLFWG